MVKVDADFRQAFGKMAPQAIISRSELAILLSTSEGAISQMAYRGELPITAFPNKRRACWFVADIRRWLDEISNTRPTGNEQELIDKAATVGRPRLSTNQRFKG